MIMENKDPKTENTWSFEEENHFFQINGISVPSVTQIIGEHIPSGLENVPEHILEAKRWKGQCYHKCLELFNQGKLDMSSVSEELIPWIKSWELCVKEHSLENIANEYKGVSRIFRYGFIIDNVSKYSSKKIIIDYKSGQLGKTIDLQMAGYIIGWNENNPTKITVDTAFSFQPIDEKSYKFKPVNVEQALYDFKTLCKASHIRRKYTKTRRN